jgi:hypothetical protein
MAARQVQEALMALLTSSFLSAVSRLWTAGRPEKSRLGARQFASALAGLARRAGQNRADRIAADYIQVHGARITDETEREIGQRFTRGWI